MDNLESLKYKDLQKLAKEAGIKANSPKAVLIESLRGVKIQKDDVAEDIEQDQGSGEESKLNETFEKIDVEAQNKLNETFEKENPLNTTFEKNESIETLDESKEGSRFIEFMDDGKEEISFRRSSRGRGGGRSSTPISTIKSKPKTPKLDYLSKKNLTPLRKTTKTPGSIQKKSVESNIPRFVKYANAQRGKSSARKVPNFKKIHEKNFKKMESLDDYVEKKKKLTDTVTKQLDKARELAKEHSNIVTKVKSSLNAKFAVTSVEKMNLNFGNTSAIKPSTEPFKFSAVASAKKAPVPKIVPKERKDIKVTTRSKPAGSKKSTKPKPNVEATVKPLLNITNKSMNETKTPGKKFDLAASLAKPLTYQPHKGKLKPIEKKKTESTPVLPARTKEEAKQRQMEVIKGVRLNKRAELLMMRRQK